MLHALVLPCHQRGTLGSALILLNAFNFAPVAGRGGFWPPAQPAGSTMSHLFVTAPGDSQPGEGPLARDASLLPRLSGPGGGLRP